MVVISMSVHNALRLTFVRYTLMTVYIHNRHAFVPSHYTLAQMWVNDLAPDKSTCKTTI